MFFADTGAIPSSGIVAVQKSEHSSHLEKGARDGLVMRSQSVRAPPSPGPFPRCGGRGKRRPRRAPQPSLMGHRRMPRPRRAVVPQWARGNNLGNPAESVTTSWNPSPLPPQRGKGPGEGGSRAPRLMNDRRGAGVTRITESSRDVTNAQTPVRRRFPTTGSRRYRRKTPRSSARSRGPAPGFR